MLDLSHILLADYGIARFATKRQAVALCQAQGWNACDVMQAFNRFNVFWVVGERLPDSLRLASKPSGAVAVPYRVAA